MGKLNGPEVSNISAPSVYVIESEVLNLKVSF